MLKRFPRVTAAIVTAGVLATGGVIAASAHELSGFGTFSDETASAPRVEAPEATSAREVEEATAPRIVFVEPSPEPSETPETEDENENENEKPEAPRTTTSAPTREHESGRTQTQTSSGHDD